MWLQRCPQSLTQELSCLSGLVRLAKGPPPSVDGLSQRLHRTQRNQCDRRMVRPQDKRHQPPFKLRRGRLVVCGWQEVRILPEIDECMPGRQARAEFLDGGELLRVPVGGTAA